MDLLPTLAQLPFETLIPILIAGIIYYAIKRTGDYLDKRADCEDDKEDGTPRT